MSSKQSQKILLACDPDALIRSQVTIEARKLIALLIATEKIAHLALRADLVARLERGDSIRIDFSKVLPLYPRQPDAQAQSEEVPFVLMTHLPDFRQAMLNFRFWGWDAFSFGVFFFDENRQTAPERLILAEIGYCVMHKGAVQCLLDCPGAMQLPQELEPEDRRLLDCLGRGLTNSEIAGELEMPVTRVKTLVRALLSRLHLENRTCAAVLAYWMRTSEDMEDRHFFDSEKDGPSDSLNETAKDAYRRSDSWSCRQKGHANGVGSVLGG
ncbi:MAG: hypothetical protein ACQETX_07035 [Pseudomonadota bacterium]